MLQATGRGGCQGKHTKEAGSLQSLAGHQHSQISPALVGTSLYLKAVCAGEREGDNQLLGTPLSGILDHLTDRGA